MEDKVIRVVTQYEWIDILKTMKFYNRTDGYVNDLDGVLKFFDSNSCLDGSWGFFVTLNDVVAHISSYE